MVSEAYQTSSGADNALFVILKEPYKKASKGTVAGWVKEAISGAYSPLSHEQRELMGIRAHLGGHRRCTV